MFLLFYLFGCYCICTIDYPSIWRNNNNNNTNNSSSNNNNHNNHNHNHKNNQQPTTNNQQSQQQQQQQQQQHDFGIFTRFHGYLEGLSTYMIFNYFNQIHPKHTGQLEMIEQNRM